MCVCAHVCVRERREGVSGNNALKFDAQLLTVMRNFKEVSAGWGQKIREINGELYQYRGSEGPRVRIGC